MAEVSAQSSAEHVEKALRLLKYATPDGRELSYDAAVALAQAHAAVAIAMVLVKARAMVICEVERDG